MKLLFYITILLSLIFLIGSIINKKLLIGTVVLLTIAYPIWVKLMKIENDTPLVLQFTQKGNKLLFNERITVRKACMVIVSNNNNIPIEESILHLPEFVQEIINKSDEYKMIKYEKYTIGLFIDNRIKRTRKINLNNVKYSLCRNTNTGDIIYYSNVFIIDDKFVLIPLFKYRILNVMSDENINIDTTNGYNIMIKNVSSSTVKILPLTTEGMEIYMMRMKDQFISELTTNKDSISINLNPKENTFIVFNINEVEEDSTLVSDVIEKLISIKGSKLITNIGFQVQINNKTFSVMFNHNDLLVNISNKPFCLWKSVIREYLMRRRFR